MRPPTKPGPKSFKNKSSSMKEVPRRQSADLGETDTSSELDQDLERVFQPTHSHHRTNVSQRLRSQGSVVESSQIGPIQRPKINKPVKRSRKGISDRNFLKSYKQLASRVDFMISRAAFSRVVREILLSLGTDVQYITQTAFEALQTATEAYVEGRLEDANLLALHARRVTLMVRDLELINYLRSQER